MSLTAEEKQLLVESLEIKRCILETGTIHLRASDIERRPKADKRDSFNRAEGEIRALSVENMKTIIMIDELVTRLRK